MAYKNKLDHNKACRKWRKNNPDYHKKYWKKNKHKYK